MTGVYVAASCGRHACVVRYPVASRGDGFEFTKTGDLLIVALPSGGCCPAVSGEDLLLLDPRAVIHDDVSREVLYSPSGLAGRIPGYMVEWLDANPEWELEWGCPTMEPIPLALPEGWSV